ncbi:uncharacterized protein LOC129305266 [Prosopis cineraria]|uniref:uncharacterized protein LOC129305266 n=1 Tax=Prosopis cineraria TaxID=364024 RepID=UPI00240FCEBE|nr:uncharacterized protein LOC129305266 [Prosopis cineraria]
MSSAGEEAFQFQELSSVIFLINDLSFDNPEDDIDASGAEPDLVDDIGDLAATYMLPQLLILSSQLNSAGGLRSVYVNFGPKGYYWLNPESWPVNDRREFENLLGGLFENGMIIDPVTDEVLCHKITDL